MLTVTWLFPLSPTVSSVYWKMSENKRLDIKTRKSLTIQRKHHPNADLVLEHETTRNFIPFKKRQRDSEGNLRNQTSPDRAANEAVTKFAKRVKQNSKQQAQDIEMRQWEEKQLHEDTPIE
ncbi:unnamed protein product [Porites evermanni]|uniref:Uncharacterized protein n=1 Tax=Porites evermanni TaxID=104178 RepID=A0ABN8PC75_9CNID|nr:unnamed protein product [Porites evermanni]